MTKILKKPEVLAPAGTLEKLKTAVLYGADACFIGGEAYGLRSRAGNFGYDEIAEGVAFAHEHGAKVYVAANMVTHEGDEEGAGEFFKTIRDIGVDAVIVSDVALMDICVMNAPGLPIHLSTQASAANYENLNFWKDEGLERVVLAREVSMEEIFEMQEKVDVEIEAFIHGAMCISYSGRCVLSNHMAQRDANRGGCCQSCRWKYGLYDIDTTGQTHHIGNGHDGVDEPFSMSAVDMSMIYHIPDLVNAGVDSLKIEGRMKSIHYVSTVCNVYRAAVDSYCEDPDHYEVKQEWVDELWKTAQRELATGFYYHVPTENEQLFGERRQIPAYSFIGQVLAYDEDTQIATIQQRNNFKVGDKIEFYGPGMRHFEQELTQLWNEYDEDITVAPNAMMICKIKTNRPVKPMDMIRKQK
ncbi:collagenase-like protease [Granulicatella sp. zg-ZJ]|uniref:peptidase U32 family protein n=1 Tax=unclassified Granulicatella TaxID=2630493 RepID=UPI0013BFE26A|nr:MULTISPECIES: U32 family peptidase [unclassified Granulicatella]MBS4749823.1 U32 family peptidase [Carnobacteriaceae bacterium zg-ZUI78]NEW61903.1 collagenase-like protease [Granulicatella sp. zg-ZJ]NEW66237.1 collagenase-like protease [Granulicatella sp. zg-84]QMI85922.1 U32 family peptidase [Carnobacteriaceae bacterium zg-84]